MNQSIFNFGFIILGVCLGLILGHSSSQEKIRDLGCYESHLKECIDCHSRNQSYALCSGYCFEPREDDNTYACVWSPTRDCFDLPKECNLP